MKNTTQHAWRIFSLLFGAIILGLVVRWLVLPASFGELGHYRSGNLSENLNLEQIFQGKEVCGQDQCHDIYSTHEKDVHFAVQCEICHGPGDIHVKYHKGEIELISKELAVMPKEYALEGCLFCHRKLSSRPRDFAQIDPEEHYEFLHITDKQIRCIECHDPHEPLFLMNSVSEARIHPAIYECDDCHDEPPEKDYKEVEDHPIIFACQDCHQAIANDFKKRAHAFLRCTGCHLYHRENDASGRIYKNGNKRFCLLCHEKKPFKDLDKLPQIELSEHLEKMPDIMRVEVGEIRDKDTACLTCHFNFIHDSNLIKTLREQKQ